MEVTRYLYCRGREGEERRGRKIIMKHACDNPFTKYQMALDGWNLLLLGLLELVVVDVDTVLCDDDRGLCWSVRCCVGCACGFGVAGRAG